MVRYNKVIELLEQGKPVFCSGLVWNGNLDDLAFIADSDYDMTIIEMEHQDFSFDKLRMSLQFLLSRKKVAESGSLQADPAPFVRVPPNFRGAQPVGAETGAGYGRLRAGAAPPEHGGRRAGGGDSGPLSAGARLGGLRAGGRARLVVSASRRATGG